MKLRLIDITLVGVWLVGLSCKGKPENESSPKSHGIPASGLDTAGRNNNDQNLILDVDGTSLTSESLHSRRIMANYDLQGLKGSPNLSGGAKSSGSVVSSETIIKFSHQEFKKQMDSVYGDDDRADVHALLKELKSKQETAELQAQIDHAQRWLEISRATATLVDRDRLKREPDGTWSLGPNISRIKDRVSNEKGRPLCKGARFADELSLGYCTGFMIDGQRLATAAHCVEGGSITQIALVFSFQRGQDGKLPERFAADDVRFFDGVPKLDPDSTHDLAVGKITGSPRKAYLTPPNNIRPALISTEVFIIGYPLGMPVKSAADARVLEVESNQSSNAAHVFYRCNLDASVGNSGSPVIATQTGQLVGVLVSGDEDFSCSRKCCRWFQCADNLEDCKGELVTSAHWLKSL